MADRHLQVSDEGFVLKRSTMYFSLVVAWIAVAFVLYFEFRMLGTYWSAIVLITAGIIGGLGLGAYWFSRPKVHYYTDGMIERSSRRAPYQLAFQGQTLYYYPLRSGNVHYEFAKADILAIEANATAGKSNGEKVLYIKLAEQPSEQTKWINLDFDKVEPVKPSDNLGIVIALSQKNFVAFCKTLQNLGFTVNYYENNKIISL